MRYSAPVLIVAKIIALIILLIVQFIIVLIVLMVVRSHRNSRWSFTTFTAFSAARVLAPLVCCHPVLRAWPSGSNSSHGTTVLRYYGTTAVVLRYHCGSTTVLTVVTVALLGSLMLMTFWPSAMGHPSSIIHHSSIVRSVGVAVVGLPINVNGTVDLRKCGAAG